MKIMCYNCNTFRLKKGFTGRGKRRNKICNLCLFKNSRNPLYMSDSDLESANLPRIAKSPTNLTENEENYD